MAENSDGQEKTEQATGKRLQEARDKGQVAKSTEINSLAIFVTGMFLLYLSQQLLSGQISKLTIYIFSSLDTLEINTAVINDYALSAYFFFVLTLAPVLGGLVVIGLVASIAQVGFKFSTKALEPKFSKFNVLKGIKNLFFSSRSFVELAKSIFKLTVISLFTYIVLEELITGASKLVDYSVDETVIFMIDAAYSLIWKIAIVYALIAASDLIFQRKKHYKEMMMTKQEIKEEGKQTEGDPLIKSKIREIQYAAARNRMMKDIPTADVVITNPTHFAVALKYEPGASSAPKVVAKGMDSLAQRIKKIAIENNIPIHEDVALARALYRACDVGDEIPTSLFKAVAQILAYIFQLKNMKKKKSIV
ncbi:MAG: flagellar biosynthesis protein FlhB [Ignavibacteria bacterium CG_4_9_14_3_um_filter_36_18]|nr:MAG: flagellar biosynthesis protein FlhB [Ignavibacteria bacterium CG_4_9_14_3_um_filter_36_18]